jgi:hypothetical protein
LFFDSHQRRQDNGDVKHVFSFIAAVAMLSISFLPAYLPAPFWVRISLTGGALIGIAAFGLHLYFQQREDEKKKSEEATKDIEREKREIERDKRFEKLESFLRPNPVPIPAPLEIEPVAPPNMRDKVRGLAHDLFAFLKEQGPGPKVGRDETKETLREYMLRTWRELGPWVTAIHNGYDSRFRVRLENLMQELRDKNVTDTGIEPWEINPPNGQTSERIRGIAEKLYILAAKMDIQDMGDEHQK